MSTEYEPVARDGETPPEPATPSPRPPWSGGFEPYAIGPPGFAAAVRPALAGPASPGNSDVAADEAYVTDGSGRPSAEVRAASTRGRAHRHYGRRRQDSYAFERTADGGYLVAAVADGVSSAPRSHRGARAACLHGCRILSAELRHRRPVELDWQRIVEEVGAAVGRSGGRRAVAGPLPTRAEVAAEYGTTLLVAVVGLEAVDGALPAVVLAVGDSSAWVLRDGGCWEPLTAVKNDGADVVESGTAALPLVPRDVGCPTPLGIAPGDALVLVTDGIGDPLGHGTGPVGTFLATHWAGPPSALEFAAHVDFARKSFDDDRTALAVWALAPPDPPTTEPAETPT